VPPIDVAELWEPLATGDKLGLAACDRGKPQNGHCGAADEICFEHSGQLINATMNSPIKNTHRQQAETHFNLDQIDCSLGQTFCNTETPEPTGSGTFLSFTAFLCQKLTSDVSPLISAPLGRTLETDHLDPF
jgi:hypothetical protein